MADRRVRWGLLSTARINERLMPAMRSSSRAELVAVGSRDAGRAADYARRWEIPRAHGSYETLLADPAVDAVYNSLPNALHAEWTIRAAEAGKHVLCEKPMALSAAEAKRIERAACAAGVVVAEAAMMRYHPQMQRIRDLVAQQAVGPVRLIRGRFTFILRRQEDVRWQDALGGGSLWDIGSYPVNFIRTALGENPVEVQGWAASTPSGVDRGFAGQMRFPSGAVGQFFSSFETIPCADAEILGETGTIELDMPWLNKVGQTATVRVRRGRPGPPAGAFSDGGYVFDEEAIVFENVDAYRDEHDAVVASILDGAPPIVTLADSRGNAAALAALVESAREGRVVRPVA